MLPTASIEPFATASAGEADPEDLDPEPSLIWSVRSISCSDAPALRLATLRDPEEGEMLSADDWDLPEAEEGLISAAVVRELSGTDG